MPATTRTSGRSFSLRERFDRGHEAFLLPIVADHDQNKCIFSEAELLANLGPVAKPQFAIEYLVIEADVDDRQRSVDAVMALQIVRRFFRDQDQARLGIGVHAAFEKNNQPVVEPPVNQPGPETKRASPETQFMLGHAHKFGEHDVNGDQIRVPAIRSRRVNQIGPEPAQIRIPPAPQVIGGEPPKKIQEMRTGNLRNAVPAHAREVHVFDALAVNMNFVFLRQAGDPFGDAPLGSVALIDEGRNNRNADRRHSFENLPTG